MKDAECDRILLYLQVVPDMKLFQKEGEVPSERNSNRTRPDPATVFGMFDNSIALLGCRFKNVFIQFREMMIRMDRLGVLPSERSAIRDWMKSRELLLK
jgi:hypothetical protein